MSSPANWTSELRDAFRSSAELAAFLDWPVPESRYPLFVPRKLATAIRQQGPSGPLARQFLPTSREEEDSGALDPIGDERFLKTPQLIHRYTNRALLLPTTVCPVQCRYCFRKNELHGEDALFSSAREETLAYLAAHPEINEVIFTGGDPLVLKTSALTDWLTALAPLGHLRFVRFHSRVPVVLPARLDEELSDLMTRWSDRFQFQLVVHSNHASEWTDEARQRAKSFRPRGLRWLSQSVLLRGVNDRSADLVELFSLLAELHIEAYYLHHPDQVRGAMHFWLGLEEGRKLWRGLRRELSGWMLPRYVIDIPQGHGKIEALNPESDSFSGQLLDLSGRPINSLSL